MNVFPKISVITPSLNSAEFLDCAIQSVLAQRYPNFEHIVVDGASTDGTLDILKQYSHLNWISERDHGQSCAMNRGFHLSRGDIIVYLNADDYFAAGAFHAVAALFRSGAQFVVGQVKVIRDDGSCFINDPKTEFPAMLKWWRHNAFCFNPAGYFYDRAVQSSVGGFNAGNVYSMDLEFLLKAALLVPLVKIDRILGVFRLFAGTKTSRLDADQLCQIKDDLCRKYLGFLDEEEVLAYQKERVKQLALRRVKADALTRIKQKQYGRSALCLFKLSCLDPLYLPGVCQRIIKQPGLLRGELKKC